MEIALDHISLAIKKTQILDDVSFEVHDGELVSLLGESGAGKSTIVKLIAGLEYPSEGRILFDSKDVEPLPTHKRQTAIVFQDIRLLCLVKLNFRNRARELSGSVTKVFRLSSRPRPLYLPDLPSMRLSSSLWLGPPNSTSLPWCTMRSTIAAASLSSANTVPHLENSTLVVNSTLLLS